MSDPKFTYTYTRSHYRHKKPGHNGLLRHVPAYKISISVY